MIMIIIIFGILEADSIKRTEKNITLVKRPNFLNLRSTADIASKK